MTIEKKKYLLPLSLLIIGVVFCVTSALISLKTTGDWFARSGSILSFVSVVVQFILSDLKKAEVKKLFHSDIGLKQKFETIKIKDTRHNTLSIASGITGILGTLIWGYGDLLF